MEGYGVRFEWRQYELLAERLATLQGKAIVSLNDHPDIRQLFGCYQIEGFEIDYTVAGGGKAATRRELLIDSWDRQAEPVGLF